jgi:hypothetical protein
VSLVIHYALAAKSALDWQGSMVDWQCPEEWGRHGVAEAYDMPMKKGVSGIGCSRTCES